MSNDQPGQWPSTPPPPHFQPQPGPHPGQPQHAAPVQPPRAPVQPPAKSRKRWVVPTCVGIGAFLLGSILTAAATPDQEATASAETTTATTTMTVTVGSGGAQPSKDLAAREEAVHKRETDVAVRETKISIAEHKAAESKQTARAATITDGVYLVGQDVQPGNYRSKAPGDNCYWARLKNTGGGLDAVIASEWETNGGQQLVTIKRTDAAFKTSGCGDWTRIG